MSLKQTFKVTGDTLLIIFKALLVLFDDVKSQKQAGKSAIAS